MVTLDEAFIQDPFPTLAELREAAPVHRVRFAGDDQHERWLLTRYDDAVAALRDPRLSNDIGHDVRRLDLDREAPATLRLLVRTDQLLGPAMANRDAPDHTRLRTFFTRVFDRRRVEALRPRVEGIVDDLLGALEGTETIDVVEDLARVLPIRVVCGVLDIPAENGRAFRGASRVVAGYVPDEDTATTVIDEIGSCEAYLRDLVAARRACGGGDLVSELTALRIDGDALDDDELVASIALMIFGAYEPTASLIGSGMLALLRHPDELAKLRADDATIPNAVEEMLRYDGPANPGLSRRVLDDVEIAGTTIPAGARLIVGTASANRDPACFGDPDAFDVARAFTSPQLAFGYGAHYCLGARLARLEVEVALRALLRRFVSLELAVDDSQLEWRSGFVRALSSLPVSTGRAP
uniref:Cytochrome P450 hydroxylase n=1 Tax=uncultured bacterium NM_1663 TaxID=1630017 RepID=A0A0E3JNQ2_9BACT|nr:cytochrome P450 hydroxylase [uncultured bacterium NM_1663]